MPQPPEDDRIDHVLRQVSDALRNLGFGDDAVRSDVLDGVREALHAMGSFEIDDDTVDGMPRVVVLDGGTRGAPPDEEGPDLRVVDTEEVERILQRDADDVRVRVLRAPRGRSGALPAEGRIRVGWASGDRPWQTIYRGESARPYRLCCDQGHFELAVDGSAVERILEGQTVDLEARVIRIRAAGGADAAGRYTRLI